jgi:glycosyltransferase involved in cell wall biosynthesis
MGMLVRDNVILMITQLNKENVERKMVAQAIAAFAAFAESRREFRLKICGAIGDGIEIVRRAIADHGIENRVDILGRVSLEEKITLLRTSFAYLQPTTCEGFGLALGEALACGTPVVTSPETCVVGIYGDAMQYGRTTKEIKDALARLADNPVLYKELQVRGIERIQEYSYEKRRDRLKNILDGLLR